MFEEKVNLDQLLTIWTLPHHLAQLRKLLILHQLRLLDLVYQSQVQQTSFLPLPIPLEQRGEESLVDGYLLFVSASLLFVSFLSVFALLTLHFFMHTIHTVFRSTQASKSSKQTQPKALHALFSYSGIHYA
jgi:hypothetical protein